MQDRFPAGPSDGGPSYNGFQGPDSHPTCYDARMRYKADVQRRRESLPGRRCCPVSRLG